MDIESKECSWKFVTGDELLTNKPCDLIYAYLVVSAASTDTHLYNGENTRGDKIVTLEAATATGRPFSPRVPVFCERGLYIDIGTNVTGVFVMWRNR